MKDNVKAEDCRKTMIMEYGGNEPSDLSLYGAETEWWSGVT